MFHLWPFTRLRGPPTNQDRTEVPASRGETAQSNSYLSQAYLQVVF
jgi:hypothetical protein